jgi:hypothetical protein
MDGKQLTGMGIKFSNTYVACMEQNCLQLFMDLAANLGHIIEDGAVVNAYAYDAAEGTHIYIVVDPIFKYWHNARYGTQIVEGDCIHLHKCMQGHPQAGHWWEKAFRRPSCRPSPSHSLFHRTHDVLTR